MKRAPLVVVAIVLVIAGCQIAPEKYNGLDLDMGNLYRLSDAKTRSISPENFTGEKGKGGMATLEEGNAAHAARDLGQGWKVNPYIFIEPGEEYALAEIEGEGAIQHIWMTPVCDYRLNILRFYWDDETEPSVEVPVGDFFASGWGMGFEPSIQSLAVCVNPRSGLNCYWQMPFHKKCRITMENRGEGQTTLFYQVDYTLTDVPDDAAYFHAQFHRVHPLPHMKDHVILDHVKGKGQYVGTYMARGAYDKGWWGEGEIKFFIDGDDQFPTICGTGEEDYFCGSYGYNGRMDKKKIPHFDEFDNPYTGFHYFLDDPEISYQLKIGSYRWHILDPVRFETDLKVTLQSLGWESNGSGKYKHLQDDMATVAYWYQAEPHNPFPELPSTDQLIIKKENPNPMK